MLRYFTDCHMTPLQRFLMVTLLRCYSGVESVMPYSRLSNACCVSESRAMLRAKYCPGSTARSVTVKLSGDPTQTTDLLHYVIAQMSYPNFRAASKLGRPTGCGTCPGPDNEAPLSPGRESRGVSGSNADPACAFVRRVTVGRTPPGAAQPFPSRLAPAIRIVVLGNRRIPEL